MKSLRDLSGVAAEHTGEEVIEAERRYYRFRQRRVVAEVEHGTALVKKT